VRLSESGGNTLLLVGFVDMTALGQRGIEWRSERLLLGDLRILQVSADEIVCSGTIPGHDAPLAGRANTNEELIAAARAQITERQGQKPGR
jgi:hypothetical protein